MEWMKAAQVFSAGVQDSKLKHLLDIWLHNMVSQLHKRFANYRVVLMPGCIGQIIDFQVRYVLYII